MRSKRVQVSMPAHWVEELDQVARQYKLNRSGLIREATRQYLTVYRKEDLRRQMIDGYQAMASLNLELACDGPPVSGTQRAQSDRE